MDYNRYSPRRTPYPVPKTFPNNYTSLTLHPDFMLPESKSILLETSFSGDSNFYMSPDHELRVAGMKIFATVMLHAWRRRREDVKRLMEKVDDLKRGSMKAKNKIHVYNTLFRVEQKRNDELTCKLKESMDNINHAKSSCESLTTSVISLKADKALLEQELGAKYQEYDALSAVLTQTKSDLFRSMVDQRNLQSELCKEQRKMQILENQKNKLINEICELCAENRKVEEKYRNELNKKDEELNQANEKRKKIEADFFKLKEKAFQVQQYTENEAQLKVELQQLRAQVTALQKSLADSLGSRLRKYWETVQANTQKTLRMAHMVTFYLLPATPMPKFTFTDNSGCLSM